MATRPTPVFNTISSVEGLNDLLKISENQLVILDSYPEWCGPTIAIMPFLNQIWIEVDNAASRIHLAGASRSIEGSEKKIQEWSPDIRVSQQGCKPLFIILRQGVTVGTIDGLSTPIMKQLIDLYLPKPVKKDD